MPSLPHKPPLHIHILFHPHSEEARSLAESRVPHWMSKPGTPGLRIPIFLTPDDGSGSPPAQIDLDAAQHNLIVVLVDQVMAQRVRKGKGEEWAAVVRALLEAHPPGSQHHTLPIALDPQAFDLDDTINASHFVACHELKQPQRIAAYVDFHMYVRALHLLHQGGVPAGSAARRAPAQLFLSHAKADLDKQNRRQDPVHFTRQANQQLPVHDWFDAREIRPGATFEDEIREGIKSSDAVLLFLTDSWASRPWCRIEALMAKELGIPIVVVDALEHGEMRRFPYGGNTRSLRWQAPLHPPTDPAAYDCWLDEAAVQGERVIVAGVREALGRAHAAACLVGQAEKGDLVLDVAPEAVHLAWGASDAAYLYPDPPLGQEELSVLRKVRPEARFETPMTRFVKCRQDNPDTVLAVSISESPDLQQMGLIDLHQQLLSDEVHLYLLLAGLHIVYGGMLEPAKLNDPNNFTLRLFELVRGYRDLATNAHAAVGTSEVTAHTKSAMNPILNSAPWPLWKNYDPSVLKVFGKIATLEELPLPQCGLTDKELQPEPNGFVKPGTPVQRYAWARALTHMREWVTERAAARLCIGGKIEGYLGLLPGLIEEPLLSLRARKPLYLVGVLGGCTKLVIDLLEQRTRPEMTNEVARAKVQQYDEFMAQYSKYGGQPITREQVAQEIRDAGKNGPAAALNNGLNDEDNRLLFRSTDPIAITRLVITGLENLGI